MTDLTFDEEILWQGSGLALERQGIQDEIERLQIVLDRLNHTQYAQMVEIVDQIEELRASLDAMDDLMATESGWPR